MKDNSLSSLLAFLGALRRHRLQASLSIAREDALMVTVAVPGERWEVEFFANGSVEIERFKSDGTITGEEGIEILLRDFGEPGPPEVARG